ncbi:uncharacterized protein LOC143629692 isoform X2 [Bidens hawaiensis]|uniref:uncharacterized protein LOC143629692 isoform X2 n=1 Tax=Bidens hawaiensis TaxID=980011 RepID=UPI00404B2136
MEQELTAGEFWLPPEFLTDEDILMDFTTGKPKPTKAYPNLTSPETESDEEDYYLNGLTRNFSKFNFDNDYSKATRVMAGSPQSTLCGCKYGSSRGSPKVVGDDRKQTSWELLYAAAGELARMRMVEEAASRYYNPNKIGTHDLHYQQLQVAQVSTLKQQQIAKQYMQMMTVNRSRSEIGSHRPVGQPPPSHPGMGMRAVFLGNPNNTKRESTGTGVFLPRQTGAPTEPAKKRGCSTVLLPDRVVQALNLNLENMEGESKVPFNHDAEIMYRQSVMMNQPRRNNNRQQPQEFRLPQEWTY